MEKMNTFTSNVQEIIAIMNDPASYVESKSKTSFDSSLYEIIKKYQQNQETNITAIIEILKKVIPSELKIDYSDLREYFVNVQRLQSNLICSCYVRNHENLEQYGDDDIVKSSELFMGFNCKTCGHFDSEHKACAKYIHTDDYWCGTCGLGKSSHTICMNYDGINDDCDGCGLSWFEHQDKYDKMKIEDCRNFIPHVKCASRCSKCIFNETHHRYTNKFHALNDEMKNKINKLWFYITTEFIKMTEPERIGLHTYYYIITKMLTSHL